VPPFRSLIEHDTTTKKFIYQKGRLFYFYDISTPTNIIYFTYDNLGNCTHYARDPRLTTNMEWERGNLLKKYIGTSLTTTYSYNNQGIRFKKESSNGKTTTYYLDGDKILGEYWNDGNEITYIYDGEG
jgi:ribosome biogenesis GTPase A